MIDSNKLNSLVNQSNILTLDNINVFTQLILSNFSYVDSNRMNLVYSSAIHGKTTLDIQTQLKNKSNLLFLVKTDEGKVFGVYTSETLEYTNKPKYDKHLSLFLVDLNEWFNVQTGSKFVLPCEFNLNDYIGYGLQLGYSILVLLDLKGKSYYTNLEIYSDKVFNMKGFKLSEVFGNEEPDDLPYINLIPTRVFSDINIVDIEVYQL